TIMTFVFTAETPFLQGTLAISFCWALSISFGYPRFPGIRRQKAGIQEGFPKGLLNHGEVLLDYRSGEGRAVSAMPTAAVLVATVLFAFLSSPGRTAAAATPRATAGHLDLSQWDFDKSPVFLDGEWEFYWNQLLDSQDFAKGTGSQGEGEGTALL